MKSQIVHQRAFDREDPRYRLDRYIGDGTGRLGSLDPFGRFRVSQTSSIFDSKQIYDDLSLFFENDLTTGGTVTYENDRACSVLAITGSSGSKAIRQTKRYFNYQAGEGLLIDVTFNGNGAEAGTRRRVGYFDDADGVFLEQSAGSLAVVLRGTVDSSLSENSVSQANWSLDTLDGTGPNPQNPSGIELDFTARQILVIDLQWLGVGTVRVGFNIGGNTVYFHEFHHANSGNDVYMRTANLPVRWELENIDGSAAGTETFDAICCTVKVEGTAAPLGFTRSANCGITAQTVGATLYPVLSIQLKSGFERSTVIPKTVSLLATNNANVYWALILNPTVTGGTAASFTSIDESAVEYDVAQDGVVSGGYIIDSGYISGQVNQETAEIKSALTLAADFGGTSDELMVCAQKIGGGTESVLAAITWQELL